MSLDSLILKKLKKTEKSIPIDKYLSNIEERIFYIQESDKTDYYINRILRLEQGYKELLNIEEFSPINSISNDIFYTYGMILIENDNIYLLDHNSQMVKLNISYTKYSLFPGQVVALKGKNLEGMEILVEEFYTRPVLETNYVENIEDIKIRIASGPFYHNDFEPIHKILEEKTDILILLGPFVSPKDVAEFNDPLKLFKELLDFVQKYLRVNISSKVIIIPSTDDILTDSLFPQSNFNIKLDRVYSFSNPSQFFISDFLFSVTTKDLLLNLYSKEMQNINSEPKERIADNLVFQNSFYPIIDKDIVDYKLLSKYNSDISPNFYIISSKFKPFFKKIGPVYFINVGTQPKTEFKQIVNINIKNNDINIGIEFLLDGLDLNIKL